LSFTTEEIHQLISKSSKSIHLEKFLTFPDKFKNEQLTERWSQLIKIRDVCNISIEEKRANKEIGSSLEAELKIKLNEKYKDIISKIDLSELCFRAQNINMISRKFTKIIFNIFFKNFTKSNII